jgi:hypothetical protein
VDENEDTLPQPVKTNKSSCCNDDDCAAPVAGGPRLGKLKGLGESKRKRKPEGAAPKPDKGGIKMLPLIMMIIVFLPAGELFASASRHLQHLHMPYVCDEVRVCLLFLHFVQHALMACVTPSNHTLSFTFAFPCNTHFYATARSAASDHLHV